MRRSRKITAWLAAALVVIAAGLHATNYLRAAAFVIDAAGMQGVVRNAARLETNPFDQRALEVPWRGGTLRARLYTPRGASDRAMLLVPGVHAAGVDEPRLVQFARDLASVRHTVLTVEPVDLTRYLITPRTTDMIEDAAGWLAARRDLATDGRVGMMGISFAGGLSIVAAARPSLAGRVQFVTSLGGHGDLPRTLQYLCTGVQADGTRRPQHDYGLAVILLGAADLVVPAGQAEPLRAAILTFLEGSRLDVADRTRAAAEFARARAMAAALPEPARTLMGYVNDRDVAHLGPILLPHVRALGGDAALSPERSAAPPCRVYLLHGTGDNVIPAIESALLARALRSRGVEVHQLATALITHAEVDRTATAAAVWRLVRFWRDLLNE